MTAIARTLVPELAWVVPDDAGPGGGPRLVAWPRIEIDEFGRIASVRETPADELGTDWSNDDVQAMQGGLLLPGFVNAHSHAFQLALRGVGEVFPAGRGSFWSWREAMYDLVQSVDAEQLHGICVACFAAMRNAGTTTVGEFHYLHHDDPAAHDWAFDEVVLQAAAATGMRVVLLHALYRTGGFGVPAEPGQARFLAPSVEAHVARLDALRAFADAHANVEIGAVAHSLRAVPIEEIAELAAAATEREMVLHLHVEEQPKEIEACRAAHGVGPLRLLLDRGLVDERTTAVHLTHSAPEDLAAFAAAGGTACLCPLTEANLGDGLADVPAMRAAQLPICLGTDSNARISMLEEARWLELGQRLRGRERGVLRDEHGRLDGPLVDALAAHGARSLGIDAGMLRRGALADATLVERRHGDLAAVPDEHVVPALVLGAADDAIAATMVGGGDFARLVRDED